MHTPINAAQATGQTDTSPDRRLQFCVSNTCSHTRARAGQLTTRTGQVVQTPVFMPVGTQASVKTMSAQELKSAGARILLANTYHLMLRPGIEVFERVGGIHRFSKWSGGILTDSGGFQIFSLPNARQMSEQGARFRSYVDGSSIMLTPELSIAVQTAIDSDIMMVLDQCVPSTSDRQLATLAMERTHRWAKRSLQARRPESNQAMFGIVQGALFEDLRKQSCEALSDMPFDGLAIGGLAVGESEPERRAFTEVCTSYLPKEKPRYLMGVGTPLDLLEAVANGVDMFDCILPTAMAQQGVCFTSVGQKQLRRSVYRLLDEPLDPNCSCPVCREHSVAYLHHLHKTKEPLGWRLLSQHNLHFYHDLMARMRAAIVQDQFDAFYRATKPSLTVKDPEFPIQPPKKRRRKPRPLA